MKSLCGGSTQPRKQPIVRLSLNLTSYCTGIASVPASFIYLWAGNTDQTSLKAASKIYHLRSREHIVFCSPMPQDREAGTEGLRKARSGILRA